MKRAFLVSMVLVVMGLTVPANAVLYYVTGDFSGWLTPQGQLMTDNGDGTYSATITGQAPGARQEFKVTDGTWAGAFPSANSWYFTDGSGSVTITFNTNIVIDGWEPTTNRIGVSTDPGTWSVAGAFQGWNNNDPATTMSSSLGGGIYKFSHVFPTGTHDFKPVVMGSWDSISTDGRSVNTANMSVTVTAASKLVDIYVDAFTGTVGLNLDFLTIDRPHDPNVSNLSTGVVVSGLALSWAVAMVPTVADPNVLEVLPGLLSHNLYMSNGINVNDPNSDPNLILVATGLGWDLGTLRGSYIPSPVLNTDKRYLWRVDMVMSGGPDVTGDVWTFDTELSTPSVTDPGYQVVASGGTAIFSVTATSITPPTFQWFKFVDGVSDTLLVDGGDISGATTNTLTITNVLLADEGGYYCIVNNASGIPAQSAQALLGVERLLAKWDFELGNANSTVAGSPVSFLFGDPAFVASGGIAGDGMAFDNVLGMEDILYTDPAQSAYFDICNHSMTVACWIQSGFATTWGPMVARNGENNEGWQVRHNGFTLDRISFTTRGTANEDGTATNRAVYDGQWHYVVATFNGTEKKVYIDGVLSRVHSSDDGSVAQESDLTGSRINASPSPVALGGRVSGDLINGLVFEGNSVSPAILDEIEIYNYVLGAVTIAQTYANLTGTPVCPDATIPMYDLDGDCIVNLTDFAKLGSEWLTDTSVQPIP